MTTIAVITITCRQNPRLAEVARSLLAATRHAGDTRIGWVIVDELGRSVEDLTGLTEADLAGTHDHFGAVVVEPAETEHRTRVDKLPAHNTARNSGLEVAYEMGADFVVFLNDCNVVTLDWVAVARDCSGQGVGWKCKSHLVHDFVVPADGVVRMRDHNDRLRPVPAATVACSCWGAPTAAFQAIGGFDTAYDGEHKGGDSDAIIRLSRLNTTFVTSERAYTVQMRRTKTASEITTSKAAHVSPRNQKLLNALARDKARIYPAGDPRVVVEPVVDAPKAAARPLVISRRGQRRPVDPPPARATSRGRDAAPVKQPISKEEYAAKKAALEQRAKSATKKPLEVTPEQLASDELYETYAPTGTDADAEIIGKPLADKIAKTGNKAVPNAPVWDKVAKVENGKSDDDILEDLGDLT